MHDLKDTLCCLNFLDSQSSKFQTLWHLSKAKVQRFSSLLPNRLKICCKTFDVFIVLEDWRQSSRSNSSNSRRMGTLSTSPLLPSKLNPSPLLRGHQSSSFVYRTRRKAKKSQSLGPVARLFGPAIFEASKLQVVFLGVDEEKHPGKLPRAYTLTHSDVTSKLTLAISQTINNSQLQGWYNRLQRDEVVAEWKKVQGKMSLHVHCHISGGHFLLNLCAKLRYFIFCKELPVVLKAFVYADGNLLNSYPELHEALVWVYFHSNIPEFNKVECWGPLRDASSPSARVQKENKKSLTSNLWEMPKPCQEPCSCCFPPMSLIPLANYFSKIDCDSRLSNVNEPQSQGLHQQQS